MLALRIVGGIFAAAFFAARVDPYQRRQISRLNLIITSVISTALLLLAIAPGCSTRCSRSSTSSRATVSA